MSRQMPGGWTDFRPAVEEDRDICQLVKLDVEEKLFQKFHIYTAIAVSTQIVAGKNYRIQILVDDEKYLLARIFKPLEGHVVLISVKRLLTKDDQLENFDD